MSETPLGRRESFGMRAFVLSVAIAVGVSAPAAAWPKKKTTRAQTAPGMVRAISYAVPGYDFQTGTGRARPDLTPRVEALERVVLIQQQRIEALEAELRRQIAAGQAVTTTLKNRGILP
jgi:hypothetical protein